MTPSDAIKSDIYTRITDQIIAQLEEGVKPWTQPWRAPNSAGIVSRPLRHNGEPYAGINVLTLWASGMARGYTHATWMTFKQALELGGAVRKGEKGSPVVYASTLKRTEQDTRTGEDVERDIPYMKAYTVFNVEQIDGLPERFQLPVEPTDINPDQRIARVDTFFNATGAQIEHAGHQAYYAPGIDRIRMPEFAAFKDAESYYATLGHECIHWTQHKTRLDRDFGAKRFGDSAYAREELVAEIGAAFLGADLGITIEDREDHAAYIQGWLKALRDDRRCIFSAAAHAERACKFLHDLQLTTTPPLEQGGAKPSALQTCSAASPANAPRRS